MRRRARIYRQATILDGDSQQPGQDALMPLKIEMHAIFSEPGPEDRYPVKAATNSPSTSLFGYLPERHSLERPSWLR
jgi:hypothetical protein